MSKRLGIQRERQIRELLHTDGWWTARAAGSFGDADVVALRAGTKPRLIEVKSTPSGPYHSFGPSHRAELARAALLSGAEAWLVWWPPRKQPKWIPEADWPAG